MCILFSVKLFFRHDRRFVDHHLIALNLVVKTITTTGMACRASSDRAARNVVEPGRYADTTADIDQLPTKYVGDTVFDNDNTGGLQQGRPWA